MHHLVTYRAPQLDIGLYQVAPNHPILLSKIYERAERTRPGAKPPKISIN